MAGDVIAGNVAGMFADFLPECCRRDCRSGGCGGVVGARADFFRDTCCQDGEGSERQEACGIADFADCVAGMVADGIAGMVAGSMPSRAMM